MIALMLNVLALSAIATPAPPEDWALAAKAQDGSGAMLVDLDSVTEGPGSMRGARVLVVFTTTMGRIDAVLSDTRIDCAANKIRVGRSVSYDAAGTSLSVEEDEPDLPWDPIKPGSNYSGIARLVCDHGKPAAKYGPGLPIAEVRAALGRR